MMTRLPIHVAASLAALLLLGGCGTNGSSDDDPSADRSGSDRTSAPPTAETSEPVDEQTTSAPPAAALDTRLLSADELPGVNELTEWSVASTDPEDGAGHGSCQKFSLVDIGATSSVVRSYAADGDVAAEQVLGEFADPKSAWRAHQVVKTWAKECAEMLDDEVEKVGRLTPVTVPGGFADQQLLQYGDEDAEAHTFSGVAIVRHGSFLSIVQIDVVGQDYNYEAGEEPAAKAAVAANAKLV
jgi:hypothetical protein